MLAKLLTLLHSKVAIAVPRFMPRGLTIAITGFLQRSPPRKA